jgi:hypothetical protein
VNSSGFIRFLATIIAGGTNTSVGLMQHTTVTVCPLSPDVSTRYEHHQTTLSVLGSPCQHL